MRKRAHRPMYPPTYDRPANTDGRGYDGVTPFARTPLDDPYGAVPVAPTPTPNEGHDDV